MPKGVIINRIKSDGTVEKKEIIEIAESEVSGYRLLNQSTGVDIHHCMMMGLNHTENFWTRVYGYRIIQESKRAEGAGRIDLGIDSYMTVCFYEPPAE